MTLELGRDSELRHMLYSLSRFRHERPEFPLELAGEFHWAAGRAVLGDAMGAVALFGEASVFADLQPGDRVAFWVVGEEDLALRCTRSRRLVKGREAKPRTQGLEAAGFAHFVRQVRDFFCGRGLLEVHTPTLVACPGLEPSLEPFSVTVTRGRESRAAYLPTSPEIHLKKALALGWTDIFEIKSCFRRGEFSAHHENEFFMLEWYRGYADLEMVIEDLRALLTVVCPESGPIQITTFAALFRELMNFELRPTTSRVELWRLCDELDLKPTQEDSFSDLFHRLLLHRIEPHIKGQGPMVVRDFPPEMAALARLTAQGWGDRFEFYWRGFEIANAFNEVIDPREQERRWLRDQNERRRLGTTPLSTDPDLIEALETGIPPTGGIALGLERLYMAHLGLEDIRALRLFASEDLFNLRR